MQQRNQKPAHQPARDDEAFTLPPQVEVVLWVDAYRKHLRPYLTVTAGGDEAELAELDRAIELIERRVFEGGAESKPKRALSA